MSIERAGNFGATTSRFRRLFLITTKIMRSSNNMSKKTPITMAIVVHVPPPLIGSDDGGAVVVPSVADVVDDCVVSLGLVSPGGAVGSIGLRKHLGEFIAVFNT